MLGVGVGKWVENTFISGQIFPQSPFNSAKANLGYKLIPILTF